MLQPLRIGHVVLKVRDLDRSLAFYRDLLGFTIVSELSNVMIFLAADGQNHHDLALLRVGQQAPSPVPSAVGLYHVAIQLYCDAPRDEWEGRIDEAMTVKPLVID
jgi:catechol-2,3-dioxygenase